jgi:excisionase family DNA binding protein
MSQESYSVSQTAHLLGISPPTVRRMVAEREIESFRTPGGHLRITRESAEAARTGRKDKREAAGPSPVLRNRRERVEELALEAQELRAQREIEKLRREQDEEQAQLEAEAEAQERQADREAEAARLRLERLRIQQAREREQRQAERELQAFRSHWLDHVEKVLGEFRFSWLSQGQRRELLRICEAKIGMHQVTDAPRMPVTIERTICATTEPWNHDRQAKESRDKIARVALWSLPAGAADREKAQAARLIQQALEELPANAADFELRAAAEESIESLLQSIEKRELRQEVTDWALRQLPWSATEAEKNSLRRECLEVLAELPADISEAEARGHVEELTKEASKEIEDREAERERERRKAQHVNRGVQEVFSYLLELKRDGEISSDELWDSELRHELEQAVRDELEGELSGDEDSGEVSEIVKEIVYDELD